MSKKKIFNDPVYGFITIPSGLVFEIIEHPYFQRLRRIRQLGLTDFVYPGALHTRFHHALGAMHLMSIALDTLRGKGTYIWDVEYEASLIAILLHDIGHGPLSHALETAIFKEVHHEDISSYIMELLNQEFGGRLDLAIRIFEGSYERPFFHQLVSSQLDVDRLDYLNRDSLYTGVMEGKIGASRLLKMLDVVDEKLVVEEKAIYSIENFLVSRQLMYWQVYLHKTVLSAENMVLKVVERARELILNGIEVPASPSFKLFLTSDLRLSDFQENPNIMRHFVALDDIDIWAAVKEWVFHHDQILSFLASSLVDRKLFKIIITTEPLEDDFRLGIAELIMEKFGISEAQLPYIMISGKISNNAYNTTNEAINVLTKYGKVVELAEASDLPNVRALSNKVEKYFVCYPKEIAG